MAEAEWTYTYQRMQYCKSLDVQVSSGVMSPLLMKNCLRSRNQGCLVVGAAKLMLLSIKITTSDLSSIMGHFSCGISCDGSSFAMKRQGFDLASEISYNEHVGVFLVSRSHGDIKFCLLLSY